MTDNPFLESWTTPFGMPPFDRIRPEHFPPAFNRGMEEQIAQIAAIASSTAPPSFADTIEALERSGRLLERVSRVFFNLDASNTDDAIEAIARDYAPRLAQHQIRIALHPALFARIVDLHARRASLGLDPDQLRLIERYYLRFVRSGAVLNPAQKERMAAISERLASLHTAFGAGLATRPGRDGSGRTPGICQSRGGAGRRGARNRGPLCRDIVALRGRAVFDFFVPPRSPPRAVGGMDRARCTRWRERHRADHPRDFSSARRAGAGARL